jgi:hypothetical protein
MTGRSVDRRPTAGVDPLPYLRGDDTEGPGPTRPRCVVVRLWTDKFKFSALEPRARGSRSTNPTCPAMYRRDATSRIQIAAPGVLSAPKQKFREFRGGSRNGQMYATTFVASGQAVSNGRLRSHEVKEKFWKTII